jgi:alpha-glucosidase (family GH31 glycosyl hydrolase)
MTLLVPRARFFAPRWLAIGIGVAGIGAAATAPIRFAGHEVELVLSQVGERTVRVQLIPLDAPVTPPPVETTSVLVPFAATEILRVRELSGERDVAAGNLRLTVAAEPLSVSVRRSDGTLVQELTFDAAAGAGAAVTFRTPAPVFGLGEGERQFDRRGSVYPMNPNGGDRQTPRRGSVVPSPFLIGTDGWALLAHRPEGSFDLRAATGRFVPRPSPAGGTALDLFVISLREPADALTEYVRLTGHAALPPKWALGYFQSHRTLTGPDVPLQIARTFREKNLPCDALIYLGTGYAPSGWNTGHGSLAFNPKVFDHPAAQIAALHALNFKVILHVNGAPADLFGDSVDEASDSPRHIANYWARHHDTFALGVDGWWPDDGDELSRDARLTRHRLYYEGALHDRPNVRPWSLHRTGYAGVQRYGGWIWSGDTDSRWSVLAEQVAEGLNHGLSLTPFWGSDTGGFFPTPELTGELYARWFQFSAFCPSFRSHGRTWNLRLPWGWNTGEFGPKESPDNRHPDPAELHNAAIEPICRRYLELRYRLLPYNYTVAREACDSGLPMMRALWLHYPDDAEAVRLGDEYLWGRDLLVAPVLEKGATSRRVYLPAGTWHDWWTGEKLAGGRWIERPVDLATLPLYVRAGAIIPLDPVRQYTAQPVSEPTTLRVFPGADGTFTLYDDDGQSLGYRDGTDPRTVWIRFHWDDAHRTLTIEPDARMKRWSGGTRVFVVETGNDDRQPQRVEFRGERIALKR